MTEHWQETKVITHCRMMADSYKYWMEKELFPGIHDNIELAKAMYYSPVIIVSHGTEKDPIFNYGNLTAQHLWKISWENFTKIPSRLSAEPIEESKRNELLEEGQRRGVTFLKQGIRIDSEGRRFYIKDVVLFNLLDNSGNYAGQGAVYEKWDYL